MGWRLDTPARFKSLYGVKSEDLEQGLAKSERNLTALGGQLYRSVGSTYEFMPVRLGGLQLWNPIIRAVCRKTVVETPLVERNGSVKEIVSTDDWVINIKGTIKLSGGGWPDQALEDLLAMFYRNEAVSIESALTARLLNGNEYVVLTNLSLPDKQGKEQSIDYEIECVSDIAFELELNDEDGNF